MDRQIAEIRSLATKHSKAELGRMVSMGLLDPQKAMMAGMMIDRIQQQNAQPPQSTVAEDVLGLPGMAQKQPEMQQPQPAGVEALPAGNVGEYAGGGIVAFAEGDLVSGSDTFRKGLASLPTADTVPPPAAPPAAPRQPSLTLPGGYTMQPYATRTAPTFAEELKAQREAEKAVGIDTEALYKGMREEEQARREELKDRRKQIKGEALMMAGLGLIGAREGQEFETLAGAGRQALLQYTSAARDIRENEKDINKAMREVNLAEDRAKRDMSGKALQSLQRKQEKVEELEIRGVDQYNKVAEKASDLYMEKYKADEAAKRAIEVAKLQGSYQIAVANIHAATANKPGETERLLGRYHNILATQGADAANKFMNELGMVRGVGKPQNTMSFEEAMKIVSNDVKYAGKSLQEKMDLANQIVRSQPGLSSGATPPSGGAATGNRPDLSTFDKR